MRRLQALLIAMVLLAGSLCAGTLPKGLGSADWWSIQKEYQRRRHGAFPIPGGGYRARGWEQQWVTVFDGRGFQVIPDDGGWRWGLQLQSYGFAGTEHLVTRQARVASDVERVSYRWPGGMEEWFENRTDGLEHGFTLAHRPGKAAGPLLLHLTVRGDLHAAGGCSSIRFVDAAGADVLHYADLKVTGASGRELAARITTEAGGLRIEVDESSADYPITIDPVVQQAYLKASNTSMFQGFGNSVAISGDTVVVAAPNEASDATGVNGDQTNKSMAAAGAAYVFVRNGTTWSQQAYLKASNTSGGNYFGWSIAISGDTIVVGAYKEGSNATGVNGDGSSNTIAPRPAPNSGAAYVFFRTGTTWSQQAYLKASNTDANDWFGWSVAIDGDLIAVGAPDEAGDGTGTTGDQTNNSQLLSGAVYAFLRSAGVWAQHAYLKASTRKSSEFGYAVSLSGQTLAVGAPLDGSNSTGVNGDEINTLATNSGAAYAFLRSGPVWLQQAYLKASNTDAQDQFGDAVAVSGDTVVVGAIWEDSDASGIGGDQADNSKTNSGAVYVFVRGGTQWSQQAYIKASDPTANAQFGAPLAIDGDSLVVGAPMHFSGEGYLFVRSGTDWTQQALLSPSNAATQFSTSIAISGDTVVAGGLDSSNATGVNGDQSNTMATNSGAAYVFIIPPPPPPPIPPNLVPTLQHFGNFAAGSPGNYRIVAYNNLTQITGSVGPTTATIVVTDPMVPGITLQPASIVASQWDCSASTTLLLSCTTTQILAAGAASTNIDFTVDVTGAGGYLITNVATVGGGGETSAQLSDDSVPDLAIVAGVPAPDLTIVSTHTPNFTQGGTGSFFLTVTNSGPAGWGNYVAVADALPAGVSATAIGGVGWNCSLTGITGIGMGCTRQDALLAGASYPVITVAANIASNAPASGTNIVSMLTLGLENQANDSFSDPVSIIIVPPPDLSVMLTHSGNFVPGGTVTFTATVSNVGAGPLPAGPTFNLIASTASTVQISGAGWNCSPLADPPTCVRNDGLLAGASFPDVTFTMQIPANDTGSFGLTVLVTSYPTDPNTNNNQASDSAPIIQPLPPDMTAFITHSGSFVSGGTGTFTVRVANVGTGPLPASPPPGFGFDFIVYADGPIAGLNGSGWNCQPASSQPRCSRADGLANGLSFPDVTVTVQIGANVTGTFNLGVLVLHVPTDSNPNNDRASDSAQIMGACGVSQNQNLSTYIANVQSTINQALGVAYPLDDLNQDGVVNLADVQVVINVALGLGCSM